MSGVIGVGDAIGVCITQMHAITALEEGLL